MEEQKKRPQNPIPSAPQKKKKKKRCPKDHHGKEKYTKELLIREA
jgi:hypothetical protein